MNFSTLPIALSMERKLQYAEYFTSAGLWFEAWQKETPDAIELADLNAKMKNAYDTLCILGQGEPSLDGQPLRRVPAPELFSRFLTSHRDLEKATAALEEITDGDLEAISIARDTAVQALTTFQVLNQEMAFNGLQPFTDQKLAPQHAVTISYLPVYVLTTPPSEETPA